MLDVSQDGEGRPEQPGGGQSADGVVMEEDGDWACWLLPLVVVGAGR